MLKDKNKIILIFIIVLSLFLGACKSGRPDEENLLNSGYVRVTFDGQDANCSVEYNYCIIVKKGGKIIEPGTDETPYFTRADGCELVGWYQNKECSGEAWKFKTDTAQTELTLYAKWQECSGEAWKFKTDTAQTELTLYAKWQECCRPKKGE